MTDEIILVDDSDNDIGYEEKDTCHRVPARLHRAFSIFVINKQGHMLIQKRAAVKKTWPNFWSNACCSHPRRGENLSDATPRRLQEELGFTCPLQHLFAFRYKADYDTEFGENEIDHVFIGQYDGPIRPNRNEIAEWKFISTEELSLDVRTNPDRYTPWFKQALPGVLKYTAERSSKSSDNLNTPAP